MYAIRSYYVEIFAEKAGHRVLFLPVHHPELNPIELVWNTAKEFCGRLFSNETGFKDQRRYVITSYSIHYTKLYDLRLKRFREKVIVMYTG